MSIENYTPACVTVQQDKTMIISKRNVKSLEIKQKKKLKNN